MKETWTMKQLANTYVRKVDRPHRVLSDIVSNHNLGFILRFLEKLHEAFGTKPKFNTLFHPTMDEQIEMTI